MALTQKQKQFCVEYLVDFNATKAAIRAGYSVKTASEMGWENLRKPQIKDLIDKKLDELALSKTETVKLLSDIAKGSLNDYFVIRKEVHTPRISKPLTKIIQEIKEKLEDNQKFFERAGITDGDLVKSFHDSQRSLELEIIRLQVELERNPKACRIVDGVPVLVDVAELDLPRLVKDKENGRIKSIAPSEHGIKVEMYAADAAAKELLKVHGAYAPLKAEVSGKDGAPIEITLKL